MSTIDVNLVPHHSGQLFTVQPLKSWKWSCRLTMPAASKIHCATPLQVQVPPSQIIQPLQWQFLLWKMTQALQWLILPWKMVQDLQYSLTTAGKQLDAACLCFVCMLKHHHHWCGLTFPLSASLAVHFENNLEVPVALNVYRPLATLVAYINKYTWWPWMMKLCALKQNLYIVKGFVEYSAQSNFYEDIWLYAVNESQWFCSWNAFAHVNMQFYD